jgi:hypothetical protein
MKLDYEGSFNNYGLFIGDEVSLLNKNTNKPCAGRHKVIEIRPDSYIAEQFFSEVKQPHKSTFNVTNYAWHKIPTVQSIADLILPGKPLLTVGLAEFGRGLRTEDAIHSLYMIEKRILPPFPSPNGSDFNLDELRKCNDLPCKDSIIYITGLHRFKNFNQSKAMERIVAFLMRNQQRRIVLTGEYVESEEILSRVANVIYF